jgi:hypothetical protein
LNNFKTATPYRNIADLKSAIRTQEGADLLRLGARTGELSPALVEVFLGALFSSTLKTAFDRFSDSILRHFSEKWEANKLQARLFGFCRNAEFLIGMSKWQMENPWLSHDLSALETVLDSLRGVFLQKPQTMILFDNPILRLGSNIVCIGGPIVNVFTRLAFGLKSPPDLSPLIPYSFNLVPDEGFINADWKYLFDKRSEGNWSICNSKKTVCYVPERHEIIEENGQKSYVYPRDYAMIIRLSSICKETWQHGRRLLIIAGCHGVGTLAATRAIADHSCLNEIAARGGERDFQAIVMSNNMISRRSDIVKNLVHEKHFDMPDNFHVIDVVPIETEVDI